MAVKGAIRIVVLVIPHIELHSRHQDTLYFERNQSVTNTLHFIHNCSRLRRVSAFIRQSDLAQAVGQTSKQNRQPPDSLVFGIDEKQHSIMTTAN